MAATKANTEGIFQNVLVNYLVSQAARSRHPSIALFGPCSNETSGWRARFSSLSLASTKWKF